ncbi:hypothetical protein [Solidesulfovibrio sp.]|uniref:hypothetical protein n=1 Tax=Solidesulfovibrio sp. TaxID=2910990 RepID=UPI002612863A|nr:hypothetical protein [Solidesulfovibrio sp.]
MPSMVMPHPEDVALVRLQTGKGHGFEVVHDARFLLGRHDFVRMPGKDPGRELPFGVQGVDQVSGQLMIAAQHHGRMLVPVRVVQTHQVACRPIPGPLPVREDLHVHGVSLKAFDSMEEEDFCRSSSPASGPRLRDLSMLKRTAKT